MLGRGVPKESWKFYLLPPELTISISSSGYLIIPFIIYWQLLSIVLFFILWVILVHIKREVELEKLLNLRTVLGLSVVSKSLQLHGPHPTRLPSMGFFRQEYRNGLPLPPPGDLPHSEIEPTFPVSCIVVILYPLSHQGIPNLWPAQKRHKQTGDTWDFQLVSEAGTVLCPLNCRVCDDPR